MEISCCSLPSLVCRSCLLLVLVSSLRYRYPKYSTSECLVAVNTTCRYFGNFISKVALQTPTIAPQLAIQFRLQTTCIQPHSMQTQIHKHKHNYRHTLSLGHPPKYATLFVCVLYIVAPYRKAKQKR